MNEPISEISFDEWKKPKISVDRVGGFIHLFFGNTPKAQISIKVHDSLPIYSDELEELRKRFPDGIVRFQ